MFKLKKKTNYVSLVFDGGIQKEETKNDFMGDEATYTFTYDRIKQAF